MIFVVGGVASGKRTFARALGYPDHAVALDVHELARDADDVESLVLDLADKAVVTCAEVGSGIVPLDPGERAWRERVGRVSSALASRADVVVRMVCGLPVYLKGEVNAPADGLRGAYRDEGQPGAAVEAACEHTAHVELVLIRHGRTPGNEAKRYVGVVDQPLSDAGRAQALAAGAHDEVKRVYVSTLRRSHETARLLFPLAEQVIVEGVQEMDFGVFTGRSPDEMADDAEYRAWVDGNCEGPCPGGESRDAFTDRVCSAMEALLTGAAQRGEERVVLVAHGGTMMAFLDRYGNDPSKKYWEWLLGNCEGYLIGVDVAPSGMSVTSLSRWE